MKKKLVFLLMALTVASTAVACGKSEKQKAAENLQEELGLTKDDANELAELFYGDDSDYAQEEVEEEKVGFELVEPKQEIINSKLSDPIVQIQNSIIRFDGSMTVKEVCDKVAEESGIGFTYTFDQGMSRNNELTEDSLAESNSYSYIDVYLVDENGDKAYSILAINDSDTFKSIYECPVIGVKSYSEYDLNCFLAGNLCVGTLDRNRYESDDEAYLKRLELYPVMSYDDVKSYLDSQGVHYTVSANGEFDVDLLYETVIGTYLEKMFFGFKLDMSNSKMFINEGNVSWSDNKEVISYMIYNYNCLSEEELAEAEKAIVEADSSYNGYHICQYGMDTFGDSYVLCMDENGKVRVRESSNMICFLRRYADGSFISETDKLGLDTSDFNNIEDALNAYPNIEFTQVESRR